MLKMREMPIKKRLTTTFILVSLITSIATLVSLISMVVIVQRYEHAMQYYGFSQGDIGKAMTVFAEARSSLRAAIGYDDQETIDQQIKLHNEQIKKFENYFSSSRVFR